MYNIPVENTLDSIGIEPLGNILTSLKNLKKLAENSFKKNLITFSSKLINTKFNLQNFNSYSILIDFLKNVKKTIDFQLESEEFNKKEPIFNLELMIKPIIDLAQSKVFEYDKATQTLIFAVNLYNLIIGIFKEYNSFKERYEKLKSSLSEFSKIIEENLCLEFYKKMGLDVLKEFMTGKKNENEEKKLHKMIFEFLLTLSKDDNYSIFFFIGF